MNEDRYIVAWVSRVTGAEGKGTAIMSRVVAERWAEEANERWPELFHWAVRAKDEKAPIRDKP